MEAKDRIMTQQQAWDLKEAERIRIGSCAGFGLRDMRMNWDDEVILKAQDKISFKAGGEEEAKGGHNSISFLEGYQEGKKAGIREAWEILSLHLPLNGYGKCFYCGVGSIADVDGYHPDKDNVWGGDQLCWEDSSYDNARKLQAKLKEWNER